MAEVALHSSPIDVSTKAFEATGDPARLDEAIDATLALLARPALQRDLEVRSTTYWEAARLVRRRIDLAYGRSAALRDAPRGGDEAETAERRAKDAAERTVVAADLDLFVDLMCRTVADFPRYSVYFTSVHIDLADALTRRFWLRQGDAHPDAETDLTDAIDLYRQVFDEHTPKGQNLHVCLSALADLHLERHRTRPLERADREAAGFFARKAIDLPDLDPSLRFESLNVLAETLVADAQDTDGDPRPLLDEAVTFYEEALQQAPEEDVNRELPRVRANLAFTLRLRYLISRDAGDLDRQIALLAHALSEPDLRWM
ncbi:hypothetical protein [Plantactinospora sp. KLBMP9567]|uniref:hypothetical protein n=1 Tax=Plantactinospora sp. KLBMP9567 TaxID=3085900 RepID=UPI002981BA5E|nr:hypothetical protein [Plantactinospora sp. KLBMP9567]MDW5329576.1 hypothetical protein [Plantactinospora sp. KLBMP9567]